MAAINTNNITVGSVLHAIFGNDHNKTYAKFVEGITNLVYDEGVNRSTNNLSIDNEIIYDTDYYNLASLLGRYATIGVTQMYAQGLSKYVNQNKTVYHFSEEEKKRLNKWLENHPELQAKYNQYIQDHKNNPYPDGGGRSKRSHRKTQKGKSRKHRSKGGRRGKSRKH